VRLALCVGSHIMATRGIAVSPVGNARKDLSIPARDDSKFSSVRDAVMSSLRWYTSTKFTLGGTYAYP
jgi:hypothetical protein